MTHAVSSLDPSHRDLAHIEEISAAHPWRWLRAGWRDLRQAPAASVGYGALFVIASYLMTLIVVFNQAFYLLVPLLGGFFLVAPALGMGLYEISRRLERGETPTLGQAIAAIGFNRFNVTTMGAFLLVLFAAWIMAAVLIFAGLSAGVTPALDNAFGYLFSTDNLPLLAVGLAVGGLFALVAFAVTAVSVPLLLDRDDVSVISAMQISVMTCLYNWRPLLLWAALIAVCIIAGFLTLYVGLAIGFPLVGHATWHAYRDMVHARPA